MYPDWLNYIDKKRRRNLLQILQALSSLQDKDNLNFIIIGALSLLVRGYLNYMVYWDVDLLFKDDKYLIEFIKKTKTKTLKIVEYDDAFMMSRNITSLHTAWAFNHVWVNVDYILRKGFFEFYTDDIDTLSPYTESIKLDNARFEICLYMAHSWDIITEKVISPRTARDVELKIDTSVDIRHIFAVYQKEKTNEKFWHYILEKAKLLCDEREFKAKFLKILSSAKDLGYSDLEISPHIQTLLRRS